MYDETASIQSMTTQIRDQELWAVVWPRCFAKIKPWRQPPHWSRRDWHEEASATAALAACESRANFDPTRGVPETAFLYLRMVAAVTTRYRQEWSYAKHTTVTGDMIDHMIDHASPTPTSAAEIREQKQKLKNFLASFEIAEEYLIYQLFWEEVSQDDLATRSLSDYPAFAWKFLMECVKDRSRVQIIFFQVRLSGI